MFTVLIFGRNTQYLHMAKDLYDWQAKGFSEIYEHTRESAAISAISAKAPDLLVVDAQAPCMAQMAFLHRARLLAPQMRVILLTSQKDFSVAQAAFDLRVDALLVWSELDAEIFSSRVDRVVSELDEMIHRRGIVKRQLFRDILKGKIPTEEESEKYFELPVKHPQYVMIRINRDTPYRVLGNENTPFVGYYAVNWHSCNFPSNLVYIATVNTYMHSWCTLLWLKRNNSAAQTQAMTYTTAVMLQKTFKQQFQDTVSVVYSQPFSDFRDVIGIVNRMDECLALQRYYGKAQINSILDFAPMHTMNESWLQGRLTGLDAALNAGDRAETVRQITLLFSVLRSDLINPVFLPVVCERLLDLLRAYCKKKHIMAAYNEWVGSQIHANDKYSLDDITIWFCEAIPLFLEQKHPELQSGQAQKIQRIIDYVEQNYAITENVPELAAKFHISGDYLRHLFTEETGEKITAFITRVKIEKSKSLLESGRFRINEVAGMVGFNSTQYFGTVFHKQTGMTPREYLANHAAKITAVP